MKSHLSRFGSLDKYAPTLESAPLSWARDWADRNLNSPEKRLLWVQVAYIAILITLIAYFDLDVTRQMVILILVLGLLLSGKLPRIFLDFSPFILLPLSYDALQGFAAKALYTAHGVGVIHFEHAVFGFIPTVELQKLLYIPGQLHWYDYYFTLLYVAHFIVPIVAAIALWVWRRAYYWEFAFTYALLTYAGFMTYLLFPAIPPWLAVQDHYLNDSVYKILSVVFVHVGVGSFASIYQSVDVNPIAAIPSLHAAYPTLLTLFVYRWFGKKWALLGAVYAVSVWVGVVYLGEHYVLDAAIGIIYAVAAYLIITRNVWGLLTRRLPTWIRRLAPNRGVVS
jgi:hypothetical protein